MMIRNHSRNLKSNKKYSISTFKFIVVLGFLLIHFPVTVFAESQNFSIETQPLSSALEQFSKQTGVSILYDENVGDLSKVNSTNLNGEYTNQDALKTLLSNTGYIYKFSNSNTVTLEKAISEQSNESNQLTKITVRGENIERTLLETNTSINVQTSAEITRSNDKRISEVFNRAANVSINGTGLQAFDFSIRGINSQGVGGAGNGATASLTVDGAAYTSQQLARGFNSLFDIEQVEILRGPQSTSQARNSLAGAVVVTTKDPEFVQDTQAIFSNGNFDTYEFGLVNTGPITDSLAYRIVAQRLSTDGFIENDFSGDDYAFSETDTLRGKLLYQPTDLPFEIMLSQTHVDADARNDVNVWFPDREKFSNDNPFDGEVDTEQDVTTLDFIYDFSDTWSFEAQTSYNDFESEDLNSNYATSLPDRNQAWFATADQKEFNQTLRMTYEGKRVRGAFGLFYSDETDRVLRDGVALLNFMGSGLDVDFETNSPTDTETQAIFGELDFELSNKWTVTVGARYEEIDIDSISRTRANLVLSPPAPYTVINPGIIDVELDASTDFDMFLPKLGVTYSIDDNQRMGFTYSEGYRQGGISIDPTTLNIQEFDTEEVKNYELSYKGVFDNGLSLTANLFYLDWEDQQIIIDTPSLLDPVVNAGESNVYGTEIELAYNTNRWDTYATFGYVKTEFDEFFSGTQDFSGNEFPEAPRYTAAIGAFYNYGNWRFGAETNYRDEYYTNANNEFKADSLTLVDLTVDYDFGPLTARAYINNVFDEVEQLTETFDIEGIPQAALSEPLTFGFQLMHGLDF